MDIDRRREAELASAQARASLQRIIETAPLAIALFDAASRRVLQLNQTMAVFAGAPGTRIEGHALADWLDADTAALLSSDFDQAQRSPEPCVASCAAPRPRRHGLGRALPGAACGRGEAGPDPPGRQRRQPSSAKPTRPASRRRSPSARC
jgi:PAS domain-containing protein